MKLPFAIASAALLLSACLIPARPPSPAGATTVAPSPPPAAPAAPAAATTTDEAHDPQHWFPFPARGIGAPTGLIDLGALNDAPAGSRGFIRASGGHFVDAAGGRGGVFGGVFPPPARVPTPQGATPPAAPPRCLGVNMG